VLHVWQPNFSRFLGHTHLDSPHTHTPVRDSSQRVISSSQRPLPTQQTQERNIHALSEIRTRNPSNQAAAVLHFRPALPQGSATLQVM